MAQTYDYFISYRRAGGGALAARYVKTILCKYGKKVFLDVDDIKKGEYKPQIYSAIENSTDFILILNEESWREKVKIDVYYEEIIRITKQDGDIIPIEFAKDVLKNVPGILSLKILKDIGSFEKISYNHEDYFLFEEKLCDKLGLTYSPDSKIKQLHHFSMPFEIEEGELVKRDKKVREICDEIVKHRIYNLVGIGGCGKTTLTYLLADQYKNLFDNIAYVVVNGNIKEDFVAQICATLDKELNLAQNLSTDEKYKEIISFMDQYQTGNNLLILDVNETADKKAIEDYAKKLKNNNLPTNKIYPNNWNILVLSREKFGDFPNEDLSDDVDKEFLKSLFQNKAGERYKDFEEIDGLLETIHYSPLLAEQLGVFLKKQPKTKTLAEIKDILHADKFRKKDRAGVSAYNRNEKETTIINFLNNLIDFDSFESDEQELLRHFVLWKSEYIQYDVIEDLLQGVCKDLEETLSHLYDRSILNFDEAKSAYKLHGLLADSLREQIDVTKQDYETYADNVRRLSRYKYNDSIINSLCEYDIPMGCDEIFDMANAFNRSWVLGGNRGYARKLYAKCIEITNKNLKNEMKNIDHLKILFYSYAFVARWSNDHKFSEANYTEAIKIGKELVKYSNNDPQYLNHLSVAYQHLAALYFSQKEYESSIINIKRAFEIKGRFIDINEEYVIDKKQLAQLYLYAYNPTTFLGEKLKETLRDLEIKGYIHYGYKVVGI